MKKVCLRMCAVCRNMIQKDQLLRIVKNKENEIMVDSTGKLNGRGAYICKNEDCLKKLNKTKALNKIFKTNVNEEIYNKINEVILGDRKN